MEGKESIKKDSQFSVGHARIGGLRTHASVFKWPVSVLGRRHFHLNPLVYKRGSKNESSTRKYTTSQIAALFVDKTRVLPFKMAADPFLVKYLADKRARQRRLTKERQKRHREKMINIGDQRPRWKEMMGLLRIDNDRDMAQYLLDRYWGRLLGRAKLCLFLFFEKHMGLRVHLVFCASCYIHQHAYIHHHIHMFIHRSTRKQHICNDHCFLWKQKWPPLQTTPHRIIEHERRPVTFHCSFENVQKRADYMWNRGKQEPCC